MQSNKLYKLGIFTENFQKETIDRMFKTMDISVTPFVIKNIEYERIHLLDGLFLINPTFTADQTKIFENCISNGICALVLLSGDPATQSRVRPFLNLMGVIIARYEKTKKLKIHYTDAYPIPGKGGLTDTLLREEPHNYALFSLEKHGPEEKNVLFYTKKLFSKYPAAVEIKFGRGKIVVMNSVALSYDRAEILTDLLNHSRKNKEDFSETIVSDVVAKIPEIVLNAFEVYEQVPLDLVIERAGIDNVILSEINLMQILEELILDGSINARISGNALIRP